MAFGGAGPLHANSLGRLIGAFPVIIPPSPGVLCALGDATTSLRHEVGRTLVRDLRDTDAGEIYGAYVELLDQVSKVMADEQGVPKEKQVCPEHPPSQAQVSMNIPPQLTATMSDSVYGRYMYVRQTYAIKGKQYMSQ